MTRVRAGDGGTGAPALGGRAPRVLAVRVRSPGGRGAEAAYELVRSLPLLVARARVAQGCTSC